MRIPLLSLAVLACARPDHTADTTSVTPPATPPATTPATPATPAITPFGLAPLRAGMSLADARAALPSLIVPADAERGACGYARSSALPDSVLVMLDDRRVARVDVRGHEPRTTEGVGVGDTEDRVRAVYAGRVTVTPHKYLEGGHYFTVRPADHDTTMAIVFETDGRLVTGFHAGREPQVHFVEGCA